MYFTGSVSHDGPVLKAHRHHALNVISDPQRPWSLVGYALPVGPPGCGVEVWRLIVDDREVPGRFIVVDRAFRPAPD